MCRGSAPGSPSATASCPARASTSVIVPKWSDTTTSPPAAPGVTPDSNDAGAGTDQRSAPEATSRATTRAAKLPSPSPSTTRPSWITGADAPASTADSHRTAPVARSNTRRRVHRFVFGAGPEHGTHGHGRVGSGRSPDVARQLRRPERLPRPTVGGSDEAALGGHEGDRLGTDTREHTAGRVLADRRLPATLARPRARVRRTGRPR